MWHVWGTEEVHTGFRWGNPTEGDHAEDLGVRWEDNIKMDLQEMGWAGMDVIHLAHNRGRWLGLVNPVMNLRVPYKAENFLTN